jgi:threonine synthase
MRLKTGSTPQRAYLPFSWARIETAKYLHRVGVSFMTKPEKIILGYRCIACGGTWGAGEMRYQCMHCGGNLEILYDYEKIAGEISKAKLARNRDYSIFRYAPLLPIREGGIRPALLVGFTPLSRARTLGGKYGLTRVYVKDDGRNPSASAKDRASAVVLAHALETGQKLITCASTGNAASSIACLTAPLGIKTVLFVPASAPRAKIAQLLVFGAEVIAVEGSYDQAYELSRLATEEYGWYSRNTGFNPYTREGKKTVSYEICEQLGWESPQAVFVPVGDGNMLSGVWKGFRDLYEIGFIRSLPRLLACQACGSNAVKRALESGGRFTPVSGKTIADSISVQMPRDGLAALKAIQESKGGAICVEDAEIIEAILELARETGVFAEPAGAVPLAALKKAVAEGTVGADECIVLLVSGNGLKDIDAFVNSVGVPLTVPPDFNEVKRILEKRLI